MTSTKVKATWQVQVTSHHSLDLGAIPGGRGVGRGQEALGLVKGKATKATAGRLSALQGARKEIKRVEEPLLDRTMVS